MTERAFPKALAATSRTQSGTISIDEARSARADRRALYRLADSGVLENRGHGVLVLTGAPRDALQRAWAAVLSVGQPCALRAEWALWARNLIPAVPGCPPQIGVPADRKLVRRSDVDLQRITWWDSQARVDELASLGGLPVLSPVDSLVTAAAFVSDGLLLAAVQEAVYRDQLRHSDLIGRRRRGLPGSPRIGRVAATYLLGHDSAFEVTSYAVLTAGDSAGMHCNVVLVDPEGRRLGPVDGFHEDGAAYEIDGRAAYSGRRREKRDEAKSSLAKEMGIPLPRFRAADIADPASARARWLDARADARARGVGARLTIEHLPGRRCRCGL